MTIAAERPDALDALAPVEFTVPLRGPLAVALYSYAIEQGIKAETVIAEAVSKYFGDAA